MVREPVAVEEQRDRREHPVQEEAAEAEEVEVAQPSKSQKLAQITPVVVQVD